MFIPAAVAKLNIYNGDPHFDNIIEQVRAAQEEGLNAFELDVKLLDDDEISDLIMALEVQGYTADFDNDAWTVQVSYE